MNTPTAAFLVPSQEYSESLEYFLKMDYWSVRDAALLFLGANPSRSTIDSTTRKEFVLLSGKNIPRATLEHGHFDKRYKQIIELWDRSRHSYNEEDFGETYPNSIYSEFSVSYFLNWAHKKRVMIDWLDWAKKENLLPAPATDAEETSNSVDTVAPTSQQHDHPAKNPNHPSYAPELHAALAAWEALYLNNEKSEHIDHTTAATSWFEKHWPSLGKTAKRRVAMVTNTKDNKNPGHFEEKQR